MKLIALSQNLFAKVDDEDFDYLSQFTWSAKKDGSIYYAIRMPPRTLGKRKHIKMHNEIMHAINIDHIDGDGLNNQKINLRLATKQQNSANRKKKANCSSIYKGIYWNKQAKKWLSQIKFDNKKIHLGYFDSEICAAKAYDLKAIELFGMYAKTNFCKKYLPTTMEQCVAQEGHTGPCVHIKNDKVSIGNGHLIPRHRKMSIEELEEEQDEEST